MAAVERPLPAFEYVSARPRLPAGSANVNLRPFDAGGLPALLAHAQRGSTEAGTLDVTRVTYVDWSIRNSGKDQAPGNFAVDLFFDGVFVNRWQGTAVQPGGTAGIRDWDQLASFIRVSPGMHRLRLVIDPANVVIESDESDNVVERDFTWTGALPARSPAAKMPDLRFVPVEGASEPLVASNHPAALATGGVSAGFTTYLSWAIENNGLASTPDRVLIHLFFDGVYVTTRIADGMTAGGRSSVIALDELDREVAVIPGKHRLKLVIDPGDLIFERTETDNVYETDVMWGTGQPQPRATTGKATLSASRRTQSEPNLRLEIARGWDGPVTVRGGSGGGNQGGNPGGKQGSESPAVAGSPVLIDFAITNDSPQSTNATFEVTVLVDGSAVDTLRFRGDADDAGSFWSGSAEVPAGKLAPGSHTVAVVVDPGKSVAESDESDNHCERPMEVVRTAPPEPGPVRYSSEDLRALTAPLGGLLLRTDTLGAETPATAAYFRSIISVAEAAYYNLVGASLVDERMVVHLLPRDEYDRLTLEACMSTSNSLSAAEFKERLEECTGSRERESGLQTGRNGRVHVFVDTNQTPAGVLATLFHELGHARQAIIAPSTDNGSPPPAARALHEAQAQLFEAAMWRGLEHVTGSALGRYPDIPVMREHLRQRLQTRIDGANKQEEHDLGYVLLWVATLKDPGGLGLAQQLRSEGRLDTASTLRLYESLLAITDAGATSWANGLLQRAGPAIEEYMQIALRRLVPALTADLESHPDLKDASLVAP